MIAITEINPRYYSRELFEVEYKLTFGILGHGNFKSKDSTQILRFIYERHSILRELTVKVQERKLCYFQINYIICYRYESKQKLNLIVLYWSPSRNYVDSSNIKNVFKNSVNSPCGHQVIVKDFNRKVTDWNSLTSTFPDNYPFMEAVIDSYEHSILRHQLEEEVLTNCQH